jgi:hypothetical protein
MQSACEAVVHTAVVGPVLLLAVLIEAAARLCQTASEMADGLAG